MQEAAVECGRDPASIELVAMVPDGDPSRIVELREAGFSHVYISVNGGSLDEARASLDAVAEQVLTRVHG
jgi:hypothetical protein